jgi:type I site-specific restriction-modification system R (restriction) subunit
MVQIAGTASDGCADVATSSRSRTIPLTRPNHSTTYTRVEQSRPPLRFGFPELSKRRNIIVIADEAHRSQYDLIDGLARNLRDSLPNASFIGFTGTPIDKTDANTRAVF